MLKVTPKVFLLVKPECTPYINKIESVLEKHSLSIESHYFIPDWLQIAREVYKQRILSESPAFKTGFEGHLWLSNFYFGKKAILLVLESIQNSKSDNLLEIATRANQAKAEFRELLPHTRDGKIVTAMNIARIEELKVYDGLIDGEIGIKKSIDDFDDFNVEPRGLWGYFYFKYIHVPSPNINEIVFEWETLHTLNVLNENCKLTLDDWKTTKLLNAFIHPRYISLISQNWHHFD